MKAGEEAGRHNLKKPAPTLNPKPNPGSESVNEPRVMKAGEEANRHNLKKPAPMIDPMSWAEMNARALILLMRCAARNAASRVEVPAADVGDRVKHDGEREAKRGGGDGKLKAKLEKHGGKTSGLTPKATGPTGLKSGLRVR